MAFTAKIADLIAKDKTGLLDKHESWERVRLSEIADILNGAPFDSTHFNTTSGIALARIRDVLAGESSTYYSGEYDDAYLLKKGDLLIGMDGDFNAGYWGSQTALLNQRVCKLTQSAEFYEKALLGYVLPGYLAAINANTPSITVKHLSSKTVGEIQLPLPPRAEQTRIVEKLEELLSDLDAGVAELKAAQRKLAQYRQSLLKAAVEGALTADWRATRSTSSRRKPGSRFSKDHPHQTRDPGLRRDDEGQETGAELLQRILSERRTRWEQKQLAKFAEQGKAPPKDWQDKYPEPVAPDLADLPSLPEGWVWAAIDQLGEVTTGFTPSTSNAEHFGGGIPFFKPTDLDAGYNVSDFRESLTALGAAQGRLLPADSVLVTCIGATIGKTGLARVPCATNQQINAISPLESGASSEYLYFVLTSNFGQKQIVGNASATTLPILNKSKFAKLPVPLPNKQEQKEIVQRLEMAVDQAAEQETAIVLALRQAAAQRKNILKAAFSGQLVPQDPNEEPASALLARIRAQRESNADTPARKRGRKAKGAA